ncbi:MAG: zinc carboxypeptidase [Elusimicrobia bacterium]|nr:zinc carboxypeptidase [Elusimicrobiota bacterium]
MKNNIFLGLAARFAWLFLLIGLNRPVNVEGFALDFAVDPAFLDFPPEDERYHNFKETREELRKLEAANPRVSVFSIGQTHEGRSIDVLRINRAKKGDAPDNRPGILFTAAHHAREHLTTEITLLLARYLVRGYSQDKNLKSLLDERDIFIVPMLNSDGVEYDIEDGTYRSWRKNRRPSEEDAFGVDLNRNYSYQWGPSGRSSADPADENYHGPGPFSEPETQAVKNFIETHKNIRIILDIHSSGEQILYPWAHTLDPIANSRDREVFETMARIMSRWNGYKAMQSSGLYIYSGDFGDWAYGEHGIFSFSFELPPKRQEDAQKMFYPGSGVIDGVFQTNINPFLYLIAMAKDPYEALSKKSTVPKIRKRNFLPLQDHSAALQVFGGVRP